MGKKKMPEKMRSQMFHSVYRYTSKLRDNHGLSFDEAKHLVLMVVHNFYDKFDGWEKWKRVEDDKIVEVMKKIWKSERVTFELNEMGAGERFAQQHRKNIIHCCGRKVWLLWDGKRWREDRKEEILDKAKSTWRGIRYEPRRSPDGGNTKVRDAVRDHYNNMASVSKLKKMTEASLVGKEAVRKVLPEELDRDKWVLNCESGVLDLRTGNLRRHAREDFMTKLSPVEYSPIEKCPTWERFLWTVMGGNKNDVRETNERIEFLQRVVGYALTGETREKVLFFLLGPTDSGKTTFLEVIRMLMGDYARTTDPQTFIYGKYGARQIRNDIARLQGARFVSASEAAGGGKLDEPLVKQLTGRDTVMARFLYQEFEEFIPEFKVFLAANRMPRMTGYDEALWNRIVTLQFDVRIPRDHQDRNLIHKLRDELPGILAWAVEGCLEYQKEGLTAPKDVRKTAEKSMKDADVIEQFIRDRCRKWRGTITAHADLHEEWTDWSAQKGIGPGSEKAFAQALDKKGFERDRTRIDGKQVRIRRGVILKSRMKADLNRAHWAAIERSRTHSNVNNVH